MAGTAKEAKFFKFNSASIISRNFLELILIRKLAFDIPAITPFDL